MNRRGKVVPVDLKIIEAVSSEPASYLETGAPNKEAWNRVATKYGASTQQSKKAWKEMVREHNMELNTRKGATGSGYNKAGTSTLFKAMAFFRERTPRKQTLSSSSSDDPFLNQLPTNQRASQNEQQPESLQLRRVRTLSTAADAVVESSTCLSQALSAVSAQSPEYNLCTSLGKVIDQFETLALRQKWRSTVVGLLTEAENDLARESAK